MLVPLGERSGSQKDRNPHSSLFWAWSRARGIWRNKWGHSAFTRASQLHEPIRPLDCSRHGEGAVFLATRRTNLHPSGSRSLECHPCLWTLLPLSSPTASPLSSNPEAEAREAAEHEEKMSGRPGPTPCATTHLTVSPWAQFPHSSHVRFHPRPMTLTLHLARGAGNIPDLPLPVDCCVSLDRYLLLTGPQFPYP